MMTETQRLAEHKRVRGLFHHWLTENDIPKLSSTDKVLAWLAFHDGYWAAIDEKEEAENE